MKKSFYAQTGILLALILLSACGLLAPRVRPGEVIFQDDFSRPDSGWDRYSDNDYSTGYRDDTYFIQISGANIMAWGRPPLGHMDLANVLIRVEGLRKAGPENNVYGVICRYSDAQNFYFFMISSDHYAGIGRFVNGEKELLSHETLLPTDAIGPIEHSNLIQAACMDDSLTLWVNGELVAEAATSEITSGDVGLIAGAYDEGGVEIEFDNFAVLMP